jgi:hypothetical protein
VSIFSIAIKNLAKYMSCLTCGSQIGIKSTYCNEICFIQGKREREINPDDAYPEFGPFFALLRASGECNMITDANCVFTSTLCLLALHGKRDYVRYLVANSGRFSEIYKKYWVNEDNNRVLYYDQIKATPPYGFDYVMAYKEFNRRIDNPAENAKLESLIQHMIEQDLDWAKGVVTMAKEQCYDKGRFARDVLKFQSLQGVSDIQTLQRGGAQLL